MMGYLFITLSAFFSISVAQILKLVEIKSLRVLNVLVINYLIAVVVSALSTDWSNIAEQKAFLPIILHSSFLGVLFIVNFLLYSKSIDKNGMGISITAMRMSLVFPILLSLWVYQEPFTLHLGIGILLTFVALILLIPRSKKGEKVQLKYMLLPVFLFFISGITDSGLKVFEQEFSIFFDEPKFLTALFFFAFLTGSVVLLARKQFNFRKKEWAFGTILGIVNLYSSYFILLALKEIPGSITFPVVNLSIMFIGTLIGVWMWKDNPQKRQWIGLFVASIAILLLVV
ncbi:EamA family transporter [Balneola vulgaris]|uniref:EamA family transporter n=1 Tax=Balneola vulgaris TaxID=287535 RepID=UPI00036FDE1B|nr:EamA family transporter [Balneola vulgaris]